MDNGGATPGMNNNFYTISPDHPYTSYNDYCDGQGPEASSPTGTYCMEMDIIEANGNCAAAATWHTWPNRDGDCDMSGCGATVNIGGKIHVKAEFGTDGWMHTYYNRQEINNFDRYPSNNARQFVHDTMVSAGVAIQSTQWHGWVPGDCGDQGKNPGSVFSISNLKFSGGVVMGPVPPTCAAPSPPPTPMPPSPMPPPPTPVVPTPVPGPMPTPAPSPSSCPGGSLAACIQMCPAGAPFQYCVETCQERCSESCTGSDDGSDLRSCMVNCPSTSFSDCVSCCEGKFPSLV